MLCVKYENCIYSNFENTIYQENDGRRLTLLSDA